MKQVVDIWDEASSHLWERRRDYHVNHAFLEGHQWLHWDPMSSQVISIPEDGDRVQATINHMRANVRVLMSNLTQRELSFDVPPMGGDDVSMRAARIVDTLLVDLAHSHHWERLREDHLYATLKGGTSAIAIDWSVANETSVETVLSIPEFVVEPGARHAETARWWIKLQLVPPGEVKAMWPKFFPGDVEPVTDGKVGMGATYDRRVREAPTVRVFTYYERPNPSNPKGLVRVEVNGVEVERLDWPFPWHDRLNLVVAHETPTGGQAYGSTVLNDAVPLQTLLNVLWSVYIENAQDASTTHLLLDDSWAAVVDQITDRPGTPLVGRLEKGAPSYLTAPGPPPTIADGMVRVKMALDDVMGVHDVSRGQAPANVESGFGLSILAEKDSSPAGRLIKEVARAWGEVANMVVALHEKMVRSERETTVRLETGSVRRRWKGSDIRGTRNITVPLDAIIPRSRAAQQQFAQQALQMGLLDPSDPLAMYKFAKLGDMPDRRGIIEALNPDIAKAIRENEMVVLGDVPLPREFDDHEVHIKIHNDFRKSQEYELLLPEERTILDLHAQAHEQMAQEQAASRTKGAMIDPALASAPRADGAPAVAPVDVPPPPAPDASGPTPEALAADMISAIEQL